MSISEAFARIDEIHALSSRLDGIHAAGEKTTHETTAESVMRSALAKTWWELTCLLSKDMALSDETRMVLAALLKMTMAAGATSSAPLTSASPTCPCDWNAKVDGKLPTVF